MYQYGYGYGYGRKRRRIFFGPNILPPLDEFEDISDGDSQIIIETSGEIIGEVIGDDPAEGQVPVEVEPEEEYELGGDGEDWEWGVGSAPGLTDILESGSGIRRFLIPLAITIIYIVVKTVVNGARLKSLSLRQKNPKPAAPVPVPDPHRYWRLYIMSNNGNANFVTAGGIEFRATADGPDLTGNGTAFASSVSSSTTAEAAFNGVLEPNPSGDLPQNYWSTESGQHIPSWIGYDFGEGNEVDVNEVWFYPARAADRQPRDMLVQWSDDGNNWNTKWVIFDQTDWALGESRTFTYPSIQPRIALVDAYTPSRVMLGGSSAFPATAYVGKPSPTRLIVLAILATDPVTPTNAETRVTSVSVGGVPAILVSRPSEDLLLSSVEIWMAELAEGDEVEIIVRCATSNTNRVGVVVYRAENVNLASLQTTGMLGGTDPVSLVVPANGFAIALAGRKNLSNSPPELAGISNIFQLSAGSYHIMEAGYVHSQAGETLLLTKNNVANMAAASWAFN